MPAIITHSFVSTVPDSSDTSLVRPSDWNDEHVVALDVSLSELSGLSGTSILLGSSSSSTAVNEIALGTNLSISGNTLNGPSLTGYVPYTGATSDVNIGSHGLIAHKLLPDASDGLLVYAANGTTQIANLGVANTANVTWYGNHNFNAQTENTLAYFGVSKTLSSLTAGTTGNLIRQGTSGPEWTSLVYPNSASPGQILYCSSIGVIGALNSGPSGVLITDSGWMPQISNTLPSAVQLNITSLGTITTGVWNGTAINLSSYASGTLQPAQFPALTGDVTTSAGSVITTIANNAVTYAKIQAVSTTSKLLGSSSTTTPVQEITIGSGLSLSGTTLTSTGLGGTVTSVDVSGANGIGVSGSPITSSGTIALSLGTITGATWQGSVVGVSYGGTGTSTTFTSGSVVFTGASGIYSQDNSNLFWDSSNVRLGIANNSPALTLDVTGKFGIKPSGSGFPGALADGVSTGQFFAVHPNGNWGFVICRAVNDSGAANLTFYKTRSTNAATKTAVVSGDSLGRMTFQGVTVNSGTINVGAQISAVVNGTVSSGTMPTDIVFYTNSIDVNANQAASERMRISSGGNVTIGSTTTTSLFNVGSSAQFQVNSSGQVASGTWQATKIGLLYGGTNADLSATGGAGQYLKQSSAGAAITVGTIPASDIASGAALTKADDTNVTLTLGGSHSTALLAATSLTLGWTGQLGLSRGGTAANLTASNGGIVYSDASALAILSGTATANKMLLSGSSAAPSWSTSTIPSSAGAVANKVLLSDGTNYVLSTPTFPNASATTGKLIRSDGTNWAASTFTIPDTYTTGDIIQASATNVFSSLAAVATGNVLISGGVGTVSSWGKVGLTTHISGTLGVGNGGTGTATTFTQGSVVYAGASGVYSQDNSNFYWDGTSLGIGTATPNFGGWSRCITVLAALDPALELASSRADADGVTIGDIEVNYRTNSATYQRVAQIKFQTDGATANQRGGRMMFYTRQNASASYLERMRIAGTGNVSIGSSTTTSLFNVGSSAQFQVDSSGLVGVGGAPNSASDIYLSVSRSATSGSLYGLNVAGTFNASSGTVASISSIYVSTGLSANVATITEANGILVDTGTTAGTVTTGIGLQIKAIAFGTTRYSIYTTAPTGGTNNYGAFIGGNAFVNYTPNAVVQFGVTAQASSKAYGIHVNGFLTKSSSWMYGMFSAVTYTPTTNNRVYGYYDSSTFTTPSGGSTDAASAYFDPIFNGSGTASTGACVIAGSGQSTTTVTTGYGFWSKALGFGTTRYAAYLEVPTGGTNNYCLRTTGGIGVGVDHTSGTTEVRVAGNVVLNSAGNGFLVKEGSNATMGVATLSSGTVTVSTTKVTANSRIFLTANSNSGTEYGIVKVSARSAGTSFTITSYRGNNTTTTATGDTSTVAWIIIEPA